MSCSSHWIALELYIACMDNTINLKFNRRPFWVATKPQAKIYFLLYFEINKISCFMVLAKLFNLLSYTYISCDLPCFYKVYYFLECGRRAKMLSINCLWEAVIPLEETMSVLVLSTQSGSYCVLNTCSSSAIVDSNL